MPKKRDRLIAELQGFIQDETPNPDMSGDSGPVKKERERLVGVVQEIIDRHRS